MIGVQLTSRTIRRFARVIGDEDALRLAAEFGGRTVYIPHTPRPDSPLVLAIGERAAAALGVRFGGMAYGIPIAEGRLAKILHMRLVEGLTVSRIAEVLHCTERHVWAAVQQWKRAQPAGAQATDAIRDDDHQRDMFEGGA